MTESVAHYLPVFVLLPAFNSNSSNLKVFLLACLLIYSFLAISKLFVSFCSSVRHHDVGMMAKGIPSSVIGRCLGIASNSPPARFASISSRTVAETSPRWPLLMTPVVPSNVRLNHTQRQYQNLKQSTNNDVPATPLSLLRHTTKPRKFVPGRTTSFTVQSSVLYSYGSIVWPTIPLQHRLYSGRGSSSGNGPKCSCGKDITDIPPTPARTTEDLKKVKASSLNDASKDYQTGNQGSTGADSEPVSYMSYLHLPRMPHRPTKDELLEAANGFWQRLKIRLKWVSIRSMRPWNIDEWGAFVSWFLFGHLAWIIVGTTTFFSLIILSINTVVAQGMNICCIGQFSCIEKPPC